MINLYIYIRTQSFLASTNWPGCTARPTVLVLWKVPWVDLLLEFVGRSAFNSNARPHSAVEDMEKTYVTQKG